eukprot:6213946-Pleurochrysis_carterae.AAC.4
MAMPVDAGALSAVQHMIRISSLPLDLLTSRSMARVATLSIVFIMDSMSCRSTFASISGVLRRNDVMIRSLRGKRKRCWSGGCVGG